MGMDVDREVIEVYMHVTGMKEVEKAEAAVDRLQKKMGRKMIPADVGVMADAAKQFANQMEKAAISSETTLSNIVQIKGNLKGMLYDTQRVIAMENHLIAQDSTRDRIAREKVNRVLDYGRGVERITGQPVFTHFEDPRALAAKAPIAYSGHQVISGQERVLARVLGAPDITRRGMPYLSKEIEAIVRPLIVQTGNVAKAVEMAMRNEIASANANIKVVHELQQALRYTYMSGMTPLQRMTGARNVPIPGLTNQEARRVFAGLGQAAIPITAKEFSFGTGYSAARRNETPIPGGRFTQLHFHDKGQFQTHYSNTYDYSSMGNAYHLNYQTLRRAQLAGLAEPIQRIIANPPPVFGGLSTNNRINALTAASGRKLWTLTQRGRSVHGRTGLGKYPGFALQDTDATLQAALQAGPAPADAVNIEWTPRLLEEKSMWERGLYDPVSFAHAGQVYPITGSLQEMLRNKHLSRTHNAQVVGAIKPLQERFGERGFIGDNSDVNFIAQLNAMGKPGYTFLNPNIRRSDFVMQQGMAAGGMYNNSPEGVSARIMDAVDLITGSNVRGALGSGRHAGYWAGQAGSTILEGKQTGNLGSMQLVKLGESLYHFATVLQPNIFGTNDRNIRYMLADVLGGTDRLDEITQILDGAIQDLSSTYDSFDNELESGRSGFAKLTTAQRVDILMAQRRRELEKIEDPTERSLALERHENMMDSIAEDREGHIRANTGGRGGVKNDFFGFHREPGTGRIAMGKPAPMELIGLPESISKAFWNAPWTTRGVNDRTLLSQNVSGFMDDTDQAAYDAHNAYLRERNARARAGNYSGAFDDVGMNDLSDIQRQHEADIGLGSEDKRTSSFPFSQSMTKLIRVLQFGKTLSADAKNILRMFDSIDEHKLDFIESIAVYGPSTRQLRQGPFDTRATHPMDLLSGEALALGPSERGTMLDSSFWTPSAEERARRMSPRFSRLPGSRPGKVPGQHGTSLWWMGGVGNWDEMTTPMLEAPSTDVPMESIYTPEYSDPGLAGGSHHVKNPISKGKKYKGQSILQGAKAALSKLSPLALFGIGAIASIGMMKATGFATGYESLLGMFGGGIGMMGYTQTASGNQFTSKADFEKFIEDTSGLRPTDPDELKVWQDGVDYAYGVEQGKGSAPPNAAPGAAGPTPTPTPPKKSPNDYRSKVKSAYADRMNIPGAKTATVTGYARFGKTGTSQAQSEAFIKKLSDAGFTLRTSSGIRTAKGVQREIIAHYKKESPIDAAAMAETEEQLAAAYDEITGGSLDDTQTKVFEQTPDSKKTKQGRALQWAYGQKGDKVNVNRVSGTISGPAAQITALSEAIAKLSPNMKVVTSQSELMAGSFQALGDTTVAFSGATQETNEGMKTLVTNITGTDAAMTGQVTVVADYDEKLTGMNEHWQKFIDIGSGLKAVSRGMLQIQMGFLGVYFSMMSVVGMVQQGIGTITSPLSDLSKLIDDFALSNAFAAEGALDATEILDDYGLSINDLTKAWKGMTWMTTTLNSIFAAFGTKIFTDPEIVKAMDSIFRNINDFLSDPKTVDSVKEILQNISTLMPGIVGAFSNLLDLMNKITAIAIWLDQWHLPGWTAPFLGSGGYKEGTGIPQTYKKGDVITNADGTTKVAVGGEVKFDLNGKIITQPGSQQVQGQSMTTAIESLVFGSGIYLGISSLFGFPATSGGVLGTALKGIGKGGKSSTRVGGIRAGGSPYKGGGGSGGIRGSGSPVDDILDSLGVYDMKDTVVDLADDYKSVFKETISDVTDSVSEGTPKPKTAGTRKPTSLTDEWFEKIFPSLDPGRAGIPDELLSLDTLMRHSELTPQQLAEKLSKSKGTPLDEVLADMDKVTAGRASIPIKESWVSKLFRGSPKKPGNLGEKPGEIMFTSQDFRKSMNPIDAAMFASKQTGQQSGPEWDKAYQTELARLNEELGKEWNLMENPLEFAKQQISGGIGYRTKSMGGQWPGFMEPSTKDTSKDWFMGIDTGAFWNSIFPQTQTVTGTPGAAGASGTSSMPGTGGTDLAVNTQITNIIYGDYYKTTEDKVAASTNDTIKNIFIGARPT